ncbi:MAG: hypothetical protein AAGC64_04780 [Bacteroidota bacterium]
MYRAAKYKIIDQYRQIERSRLVSEQEVEAIDLAQEERAQIVLFEDFKSNLLATFRKLPQ